MIFVIDSSDIARMHIVKNELLRLLAHPSKCKELSVAILAKSIPILFYANKMDLPEVFTEGEVAKVLDLDGIKDRPWNIL